MIAGTEKVWSLWVLVIAAPVALAYANVAGPVFSRFELRESTLAAPWAVIFWALILSAVFYIVRAYVLGPIRGLRRACRDDAAFARHCVLLVRKVWPYGLFFGLALGQLAFEFGTNAIFVQAFLLWLAHAFIAQRRRAPIRRAVDALLNPA